VIGVKVVTTGQFGPDIRVADLIDKKEELEREIVDLREQLNAIGGAFQNAWQRARFAERKLKRLRGLVRGWREAYIHGSRSEENKAATALHMEVVLKGDKS